MQKYKVVVTIPAIIEVTAETACNAHEIVKGILAGQNADVIQSAVHKAIQDGRENTYVQTLHIRK